MSDDKAAPLAGLQVLIVEDRYLIATDVAAQVGHLGGKVLGPCRDLACASDILEREPVDLALLDVSLDDTPVFPLARVLEDRGVPFVFLTGYDEAVMPAHWRERPRLAKPVSERALREEVARVFARLG